MAKAIIQKALSAAAARAAARKARDLARRKGALSSGNLPGKLADCQSKNVEECLRRLDTDYLDIWRVQAKMDGSSQDEHMEVCVEAAGKLIGELF